MLSAIISVICGFIPRILHITNVHIQMQLVQIECYFTCLTTPGDMEIQQTERPKIRLLGAGKESNIWNFLPGGIQLPLSHQMPFY